MSSNTINCDTPGYYCSYETDFKPKKCPAGLVCPRDTWAIACPPDCLCPPGTIYNPKTRCLGTGATYIEGNKPELRIPANFSRPGEYLENEEKISKCPIGKYCPQYNTVSRTLKNKNLSYINRTEFPEPIDCRPGNYCPEGSITNQCSTAYYCPSYTEQKPCPDGHYCPRNSKSPLPCPKGTISSSDKTRCGKPFYELCSSSSECATGCCSKMWWWGFGSDKCLTKDLATTGCK